MNEMGGALSMSYHKNVIGMLFMSAARAARSFSGRCSSSAHAADSNLVYRRMYR